MAKKASNYDLCCISSCSSSRQSDANCRFFSFPPNDTTLGQIWREKCCIDINYSRKRLKICEKHFDASDIGRKYLKRSAIPIYHIENMLDNDYHFPDPSIGLQSLNRSTCQNCVTQTKCSNYYRKLYVTFLRENKKLREEVKQLKKGNGNCLSEAIDSLKNVNSESKVFAKLLLKPRPKKYDELTKSLTQNIYYVSRNSYLFLKYKLKFNLPHESTILNWTPIKDLQPGFCNSGYNMFKKKCETLRQIDKENVVMLFDEASIREELRYNSRLDLIDGFEDEGFYRSDVLGQKVCVFMIKGIFSNFSLVLNYFISAKGLDGDCLGNIIIENIKELQKIGVFVKIIVCDQGSGNRKVFSVLGVTPAAPYFWFNETKIFCIYDFPHLLKSLRNNLLTSDLSTPDGIVSFKVLKELWELEQGASTRLCPKLSRQHLEPTHFEKMKVKLATQIFSKTVQAAIRAICHTEGFKKCSTDLALSTADFIKKIDKVFDCMNSQSLYGDNSYRSAIQIGNVPYEYIKEFLSYWEDVKFLDSKKQVHFLKGFKISLNAILQYVDETFNTESNNFFLMTRLVTQDKLENYFSILRQKGGYNRNPSVSEVNTIIARTMTRKLLSSSPAGNCEVLEDDNSFEATVESFAVVDLQASRESRPPNATDLETSITEDTEFDCCILESPLDHQIPQNELASLRYFVGYVAFRILPRLNCDLCNKFVKTDGEELTSSTELFLFYKNYSTKTDFGSLKAPSEEFFNICREHVAVFRTVFEESPQLDGIKAHIVEKCKIKTPEWFSDPCSDHKNTLLDFLLLVLLRKHCLWRVQKKRWTK